MAQAVGAQAKEHINETNRPGNGTSEQATSPEVVNNKENSRSFGGENRNHLSGDLPVDFLAGDADAEDKLNHESKPTADVYPFRSDRSFRGAGRVRRSVSDSGAASPVPGQGGKLDSHSDRFPVDGSLALQPDDEDREPVQSEPVKPLRLVPQQVPEQVPASEIKAEFDGKRWKVSRERSGHLIKRIEGYDITEDKYGISYLFRLPKGRTTTKQGEHSGYLNWAALEAAGRLKKVGDLCTM